MRILVTGGAGFIGSNFIRYYLAKHSDDSIINLDALTYAGNLDNLKEIKFASRYEFVRGNICDKNLVDDLVNRVDAIVHFAAETHVDRSIKEPAIFVKTNVMGTQVLLEAARKQKKRFHHVSTDEVYGSLALDKPKEKFSETTSYNPSSPYSASKAAADHLVRAYFHTFGLQATITNCTNNYGAYQHPEKLIPCFITNLIEGKKLPIYGDGKNIRDWLYVEDHCTAIDLVLHNGKFGQTYCVGGNEEKSNLDVAYILLAAMRKDDSYIEFVQDRKGHDRRYAMDSSKISQELGWKPRYDFNIGIQKTIKWYQDHKTWWKSLKK